MNATITTNADHRPRAIELSTLEIKVRDRLDRPTRVAFYLILRAPLTAFLITESAVCILEFEKNHVTLVFLNIEEARTGLKYFSSCNNFSLISYE